jgi:ubiquinone/menaquinone biosynthesis C-methylase UbiE
MESNFKKFTEANRAAWNEVTPKHQIAAKEKWDRAFMQPGYVVLDVEEVGLLKQLGIEGKAVGHLCCNNGIELLSIKNLGAGECVGFDIADSVIQEARERAAMSQIDCQFVRSDVYEIGPEYDNRFDVVYISSGGMGWLPDLKRFFAKVASLLKGKGWVFIHEIHPVSEMLPFDNAEEENVLQIIEPYFKADPYIEYGGLDYVGGERYDSDKPQYWFVHKISDILMGLIENQIQIEHFAESEKDISAGHQRVEQAQAGVPLSYILIGKRTDIRNSARSER